jgi:hypothetical protein
MAQGFSCFCGAAICRGFISGAKNMSSAQLEGVWLNAHIRALIEERDADLSSNRTLLSVTGNGTMAENETCTEKENGHNQEEGKDETEEALKLTLAQARKMVDAAQKALDTYKSIHGRNGEDMGDVAGKGANRRNRVGSRELSGEMGGDTRRGVTSRELSGEMGGDTLMEV